MANIGFSDIESERTAINENTGRYRASAVFATLSTPTLAINVSAAASLYPNLPPSLVLSGAVAGMDPLNPMWKDLDTQERARREQEYSNYDFNPLSYAADVVQGTYGISVAAVRGGMIAFDTIWEEGISHPLRTGVLLYQDDDQDMNWGSAWAEASPSSGVRGLGQFFGDPFGNVASAAANYMNLFTPFSDPFEASTESRVNLGSGYFANSDILGADDRRVQVLIDQGWDEAEAMKAVTGEVYGTPVTQLFREGADAVHITGRNGGVSGVSPGRLAAIAFTEPGTQPFNLLSGTMDLGAQIFLDPSNLATAGLSKARLASKGLRTFENSSGLVNGIRRTVLQQDVNKALNTGIGRGALKFLSDTDDLALIDSILSPATRTGQTSPELLRQVAATNDVDEMYKLVHNAVSGEGAEINKKFWKTSMFGQALDSPASMTGRQVSGANLRARSRVLLNRRESGLVVVNREVDDIVQSAMPDYGGFRPSFRARRMDSSIIYDAATGRLGRRASGRNARATSRLFSQMSGERIDISNIGAGFTQVRRLARSLDLTPEETQKALERWVELGDDNVNGALAVVEGMMGSYRKKLYNAGVSEEVVDSMTAIYKNQDEMRRYFVDEAANPQDPGVFTMLLGNGESVPVPLAHIVSEMAGTFIPVPGDPRQIRRMTDFIKRSDGVLNQLRLGKGDPSKGSIWYNKQFQDRMGLRLADNFMSIWKPAILLRPAWTIRVVGEEQARLAAAGLSEFNHPFRAMVVSMTDKNLKLGMTTRKKLLDSDVYGDSLSLATDYQNAMSRRGGTWFDSPGGYGGERWIKVEMQDKNYDKWWFRELNQLQSDRTSSAVAKAMVDPGDARGLDAVKESFFDGDLASQRLELMGSARSPRHKSLNTRAGSDAYIESVYARLHLKTGGRYETLRDDGYWYNDLGERLRAADAADQGVLRQANSLVPKGKGTGQGTRIQTRSLDQHRSALSRSGLPDADVDRKMNYLSSRGTVDDASFVKLDPDARTVLIEEGSLLGDDIVAEARTVQFRVTESGETELLEAVSSGNLRGVNFSGEINASIERQATKALKGFRDDGLRAPQAVKGVDESDVGKLDNAMNKGFDLFMGKPTNRFSRSPAFTRSYWNTVTDLADQGLIDTNTVNKLQRLMSSSKKSVTTEATRKALRYSERMDEQVRTTERLYADLNDELVGAPAQVKEALEPTVKRLKSLMEGDSYDVGRYNRIIQDMGTDLKTLDADLAEGLERARALKKAQAAESAQVSAAERADVDKLINQLESHRDDIGRRLKSMEDEFDAEAVEDLDILYGAMDEMPDTYVDGLDPSPHMDGSPSDVEDAIRAEMRAQQESALEPIPTDLDEQIENLATRVGQDEDFVRRGIESEEPVRRAAGDYEYPNGDSIERTGKNWTVTAQKGDFEESYPTLKAARAAYREARLGDQASMAADIPKDQQRLAEFARRRSEGEAVPEAVRMGQPVGELEKIADGAYVVKTERGTFRIEKTGDRWRITEPDTPRVEQLQVESKRAADIEVEPERMMPGAARSADYAAGKAKMERFTDAENEETFRSAKAARESLQERIAPDISKIEEGKLSPEQIRKLKDDFDATDDEIARLANQESEASSMRVEVEDDKAVAHAFNEMLPNRPNQLLSIEEVDRIAKAAALTETQELLYDLSRRSNFSDMFRIVMPFAEAWFEIISTWSRLVQGNPATLQRFQQAYKGLQEDVQFGEGAFTVEGHDGSGFFYVDPRTKQEMFAIPHLTSMLQGNEIAGGLIGGAAGAGIGGLLGGGLPGAIKGAAVGAVGGVALAKQEILAEGESVDLGFNVQGVNMAAGSAIPGIGPLAAVPISWVLSKFDGESAEMAEDLLLPFGEPNVSSVGDFVDSLIPSWANKFLMAADKGLTPDQQRIRANTTIEVAGMMVRRGEGSFSTPEEMKETLAQASKKSGWLYAIRGLAAAAGPTAPSFTYNTEDKNGSWFFTSTMANQWNETLKKHDGDEPSAFDEFTGMYGLMPQTFMVGKTQALTNAPLTKNAYSWKKENEEIYQNFPGTAYLLNPTDLANDEFDYDAYIATLKEGTRVSFTPEQWAQKSNSLAANVIMERFRKSASAFLAESPHRSVDQQKVSEQLYSLQMALMKDYPGYNREITGTANPMSPEEKLDEISRWTPEMKSSAIGTAVVSYLAARDNAEAISLRSGNSKDWWKISNEPEAVQIRDELIAIATMLKVKEPSFISAWTTLFSSDMRDHIEMRSQNG